MISKVVIFLVKIEFLTDLQNILDTILFQQFDAFVE